MGSSRFPGKVLRLIGKRKLLEHVFFRLRHSKVETTLIVATPDITADDPISELCRQHEVACFRGSELNVLDRYYRCALRHAFDHIVRLTGDNPFVDIEEMDRLIRLHLETEADFSYSFQVLPIGCGAEIFSFPALATSFQEGHASHHLEHVDEYIFDHLDRFRTSALIVPGDKQKPKVRLTVDTPEDYARACFIVKHSSSEYVSTEEAIALAADFDHITRKPSGGIL